MSISRHVLSILALSLQVLGYSADGRKVYAAVGRNIDLYCGTSKDDAQHGNWTYQEKESELGLFQREKQTISFCKKGFSSTVKGSVSTQGSCSILTSAEHMRAAERKASSFTRE
ncbi:hypothetical protein Aduo_008505 [Ancylostoma duodenale]